MRFWYRAMVTLIAVTSVFCISVIAYVGFELWAAGERQQTVLKDDLFQWSNGFYEATGTLTDGVLEEMVIRRMQPVLPG